MLLDGKKLLVTGVLTKDSIAAASPGWHRSRAPSSCSPRSAAACG